MILNERNDVLAWNDLATALIAELPECAGCAT